MTNNRRVLLNRAKRMTVDRGTYRGRSLSFVRTLLNLPPHYESAASAMEASRPLHEDEPPLQAVAWYRSNNPYGNCAVSLGRGKVLALDPSGKPLVCHYRDERVGVYQGWSETVGRHRFRGGLQGSGVP